MSVRHIDYLKIKPSRILVVEIRPVRCIIETPSGPSRTAKWMTYKHWKELRLMLNEIADYYEEQRHSLKTTEDIECNKGKTKEGSTIKIGYMFTTYRKCSCIYMTPRDTWSDDEDDEEEDLQDKGGRYQQFLPCGEMLVVSVALQEPESLSQAKGSEKAVAKLKASGSEPERLFMSPARSDRQLLKALDSSIIFKNTISDYFDSSEKKSVSESSSIDSQVLKEVANKDKQSTLKNILTKSKLKHSKRKHGELASHTIQSENELPNKRQVKNSIHNYSAFFDDSSSHGNGSATQDLLSECSSGTQDCIRNGDLPNLEETFESSMAVKVDSDSFLEMTPLQDRSMGEQLPEAKIFYDCLSPSTLTRDLSYPAKIKLEDGNSNSCQDEKSLESLDKINSPVLQRRTNYKMLSFSQVLMESVRNGADKLTKRDTSSSPDIFKEERSGDVSKKDVKAMHSKEEDHKMTKRRSKLNVLFGDCDEPCKEKNFTLDVDQEYKPLPIDAMECARTQVFAKSHQSGSRKFRESDLSSNDDSTWCRRSKRIKQNKEKCAEGNKTLSSEDSSDLPLSPSKDFACKSHSLHSRENLDITNLNVNDVFMQSGKLKKNTISEETRKGFAQFAKICRDLEEYQRSCPEDSLDLLDLSQTSGKDFVKPLKNSKKTKKNKTESSGNQSILDGWITPKGNTNGKSGRESSQVTLKLEKKNKKEEKVLKASKTKKSKDIPSKKNSSQSVKANTSKVRKSSKDKSVTNRSVIVSDRTTAQTMISASISKETASSTNGVSNPFSKSSSQSTSKRLHNQNASDKNHSKFVRKNSEDSDSLPDIEICRDGMQYKMLENCTSLSLESVDNEELHLRLDEDSCSSLQYSEDMKEEGSVASSSEVHNSSISAPVPWNALHGRLLAMSLEELEDHMKTNLPYLKKIPKGQEPSKRHEIFKAGGKEFRYMADEFLFGPFPEDHILHAVDYLNREFSCSIAKACGKDRVNEYIWKVLAPSFFLKIVMQNENVTSSEAEELLVAISTKRKIDN